MGFPEGWTAIDAAAEEALRCLVQCPDCGAMQPRRAGGVELCCRCRAKLQDVVRVRAGAVSRMRPRVCERVHEASCVSRVRVRGGGWSAERARKRVREGDGGASMSTHASKCCVCREGGTLMLCEGRGGAACRRVAHVSCAGLDRPPKGPWRCDLCAHADECYVCGGGGELLICEGESERGDQCTRSAHVMCAGLVCPPPGQWLCRECKQGAADAQLARVIDARMQH